MNIHLQQLTGRGSPFELENDLGDGRQFRHAPRTLSQLYDRAKSRAKARDAVIIVSGYRRITTSELLNEAGAISALFQSPRFELCRPRRAAILTFDPIEAAIGLIGTTDAGIAAVLVPFSRDAETVSG